MGRWLKEWDTGMWYGPASAENEYEYAKALGEGNDYFLYPYFGHQYHLKMVVDDRTDFRSGFSSKGRGAPPMIGEPDDRPKATPAHVTQSAPRSQAQEARGVSFTSALTLADEPDEAGTG